jgi:hypothetical protein
VIIKLSSDLTKFRSTMIKFYYDDDYLENSSLLISIIDLSFIAFVSKSSNISESKNQLISTIDQKSESEIFSNLFRRDRDRFRKYFASTAYLKFVFNTIVDLVFAFASTSIFVFVVVFKLDSIIHIAFSQFAAFKQKEINDLIETNVFQSINKNDVSFNVCIFNFRIVNEIKHFDIDKAFKKSRFVMQTFNDQNKNLILIQFYYSTNQSTFDCMSHRRFLEDKFISQRHYSDIRTINHVIESRVLCSLIC